MKPGVNHFEIGSKDFKKAQEFYSSIFDWEIAELPDMGYAMVTKGNDESIGGGIKANDNPPSVTFYITVDDIGAYLSKIESAGGKTIMPETAIGENMGFTAMFSDLDGNMLGLYKTA